MPACGIEQSTEQKPDHIAIYLAFNLSLVSQGYRGQKSYEPAERAIAGEVATEYARARREHVTGWSTALAANDVDQLWDFWCRAAEKAL
eukprot:5381040-Amphidinium_carterae.1